MVGPFGAAIGCDGWGRGVASSKDKARYIISPELLTLDSLLEVGIWRQKTTVVSYQHLGTFWCFHWTGHRVNTLLNCGMYLVAAKRLDLAIGVLRSGLAAEGLLCSVFCYIY